MARRRQLPTGLLFCFLPTYRRQRRNGYPHGCVASTPLNPEQHSNPDEGQRPPGHPPISRARVGLGARTVQEARQQMTLWEKFNGEVPGVIFWPIMFVMLGVLIPIVMAIR